MKNMILYEMSEHFFFQNVSIFFKAVLSDKRTPVVFLHRLHKFIESNVQFVNQKK